MIPDLKTNIKSSAENERLHQRAREISERIEYEDRKNSIINLFSVSAGSIPAQNFEVGFMLFNLGVVTEGGPREIYSAENIKLGYAILEENIKSLTLEDKEEVGMLMAKLHSQSGMSDMVLKNENRYTSTDLSRPTHEFTDNSEYVTHLILTLRRFSDGYDEDSFFSEKRGTYLDLLEYLDLRKVSIIDLFTFLKEKLDQNPKSYVKTMRGVCSHFNYYSMGRFSFTPQFNEALDTGDAILKEFKDRNKV